MQESTDSFGYWLRRRRKALDLTQEALAARVHCSGFTIRKIEADERRPSRPLADRLAIALGIPEEERAGFLAAARAVRAVHHLPLAVPVSVTGVEAPVPAAQAGRVADGDGMPFVGRELELGLMDELLRRATAGTGAVVLIEGEPGIGKSRLIREAAAVARARGLPVFQTNCYEIERGIPYQPVIALVSRLLDDAWTAVPGGLSAVSLAELAGIAPAVAERFQELPNLSGGFPEARQARLAHAIGQLIEVVRRDRPLVLVADNIHWADEASLRVLHFLARRSAEVPLLLIFACRDDALETDERLAGFAESLGREVGARRVPLHRLELAATERLLASLGHAAGLAERLHRETDGNPFFLTSILHAFDAGELGPVGPGPDGHALLPDTLRTAVRGRIAQVPPAGRTVLEAASVFGGRFDFDTLLDATGMPEPELLDALDVLARRHLLREVPGEDSFDFSHDKIREVVHDDLGSARRRHLNRLVAEALERRPHDASHERDARLAEHFVRAHDWPRALRHLVVAASRAQALFALRDALDLFDRAVSLSEAHPGALDEVALVDLFERRGEARVQAGQTDGAVADFGRVITAASASGDEARARHARILLGMAYRRADAYEHATQCLFAVLEQARAMHDPHQAADILYHLGTVAWSTGRNDRAVGFHAEAVHLCEEEGFRDLVAVQAFHGRGESHFASAEPREAIACYARSLELARAIGDRSYECENLMMIGHACTGTRGIGDYARATATFEQALSIAEAADLQWHVAPTVLGLEHVRACTGHYGQAWSGMRDMLATLESLGQVRYQFIAYAVIGQLLLDLDLAQRTAEFMDRAVVLARDTGIRYWVPTIEAHRAVALARLGERDLVPRLRSVLDETRERAERYHLVRCLDGLAEVALASGDTHCVHACADELCALARAGGLRELEATAHRWRAEALFAEKAYSRAEAAFLAADAIARDVGRMRLQLDVSSGLARTCDALGRDDDARRHGEAARSVARAIVASLGSCGLEAGLEVGGRSR